MQAVKDFVMWFISQLPDFLMSEPFCYFVGFFFLFVTARLVARMCGLGGSYKI